MAEEKTIVLKLETITDQAVMEAYGDTLDSVLGKYDENVKQLNAFNAQLKANNDAIKAINAEAAKTGQTTKEQSEAIAKLTAENGKLNAQKSQLVQITKNQEKVDTTVTGTMENQSQLLGKLRMAWRKMTDEQKQANSGLLDTINQLDKGLKDSDGSIGNFQRNVGDYKNAIVDAFAQLKGEIKQYKNELLTLEEGTQEYNDTLAKLGNAQFQMKDMTDKAKYAVDDLGEKLGTIASVGQGVIGGFNAIQGAMALFGGESEDLQKTMMKLQAGMAIVQGLQGVEGLVDSVNGLRIQFSGSIQAVKAFIGSLKGVRAAVAATGIGLLAVGIGTAIAYWEELTALFKDPAVEKRAKEMEELNKHIEEFRKTNDKVVDAAAGQIVKLKELSNNYKELGNSVEKKKKFINEYKDSLADLGIEVNNISDAERVLVNDTDKYIEAIFSRAKADAYREKAIETYKEALKKQEAFVERARKKGMSAEKAMASEFYVVPLKTAERNLKEGLKNAAKYEDLANKLLKPKKSGGGSTKSDDDKKNKGVDLSKIIQSARDAELKELEKGLDAVRDEVDDTTDRIKDEFKTIVDEIEQEIANDSALSKVAESPLARALGVSDEEFESIKSKAQSLATQLFSSISQISQDATQRRVDNEIEALENEAKREKDILKSKLDKGSILQAEYEQKLEALDEESAKKKEQLNKEAFVKNKAWNIAQAVMNTALSITNILATNKGGAIARAIEVATATAAGIAQVATIAAQKYARGGLLVGPSHAQGGIPGFVGNRHIEAEGGEAIINKRSTAKHRKLLSLINSDNGWGDDFANARSGSRFARGGILGYNFRTSALPDTRGGLAMFAQQQTENIQNAISAINQRIDNLRVYLPLSDIEQRSNEKRVNVSRAVFG